MRQTRTQAFLEALVSTAIGFVVAFVTNLLVLPLFGMPQSLGATFWITVIFTIVSIVRQYCVRRMFDRYHHGY